MSEWHYLRCESHTPPLLSREEVCQHPRDLDEVRAYWADGQAVTGLPEQWRREISAFGREHPDCQVVLVSEIGVVRPLTTGGGS